MKKVLSTILLTLVSINLSAKSLASLTVDTANISTNQQFDITIKSNADTPPCGLEINFGDGTSRNLRGDKFPLLIKHSYATAGNYSLAITGKLLIRGLNTLSPCAGEAKVDIIVVGNDSESAKSIPISNDFKLTTETGKSPSKNDITPTNASSSSSQPTSVKLNAAQTIEYLRNAFPKSEPSRGILGTICIIEDKKSLCRTLENWADFIAEHKKEQANAESQRIAEAAENERKLQEKRNVALAKEEAINNVINKYHSNDSDRKKISESFKSLTDISEFARFNEVVCSGTFVHSQNTKILSSLADHYLQASTIKNKNLFQSFKNDAWAFSADTIKESPLNLAIVMAPAMSNLERINGCSKINSTLTTFNAQLQMQKGTTKSPF